MKPITLSTQKPFCAACNDAALAASPLPAALAQAEARVRELESAVAVDRGTADRPIGVTEHGDKVYPIRPVWCPHDPVHWTLGECHAARRASAGEGVEKRWAVFYRDARGDSHCAICTTQDEAITLAQRGDYERTRIAPVDGTDYPRSENEGRYRVVVGADGERTLYLFPPKDAPARSITIDEGDVTVQFLSKKGIHFDPFSPGSFESLLNDLDSANPEGKP